LKCSGRNQLCEVVLNDDWVAVPADSDFQHSPKTEEEEILFHIEDERYHLDMKIESSLSTLITLEACKDELDKMSANERETYKPELRPYHESLIRKIYGEYGDQVLSFMSRKPVSVVPIVLERVKEKNKEWQAAKRALSPHWAVKCRENYWRSLDHQGEEFADMEENRLLDKSILIEMKAIGEDVDDREFRLRFADGMLYADVHSMILIWLKKYKEGEHDESWMNTVFDHLFYFFKNEKEEEELPWMYGDEGLFLFYEFLFVLYHKLSEAREMTLAAPQPEDSSAGLYEEFKDLVRAIIEKDIEAVEFKDWCIANIGVHTYPLYTTMGLIEKLGEQVTREVCCLFFF